MGLVIFENKLKPGTTPAIQTLRAAHFACRMITGDNPLTAVSVARECGLINPAAQVFAPMFLRVNASTPLSKLEWYSMDEPTWKLDSYSLKPLPPPANRLVETEELESQDYTLAVTGDVFRWVINHAPLETMQRVCSHCADLHPDAHWWLCDHVRCWSRRKSTHACRLMRRTRLSSGCKASGIRFSCVVMARTTVLLSKPQTSACRCQRRRPLSRRLSQVGRRTSVVSLKSSRKAELRW